jgi:hypothetical protein
MTPRDFSEPWEPEDIFDREEAARRRRVRDDMIVRNAAITAQEEAAEAARQADLAARRRQAGAEEIVGQYQAAGVKPLAVNADGVPLVSLSMLLSMGWTVVQFEGAATLVQPQHIAPPRKKRGDYDENT